MRELLTTPLLGAFLAILAFGKPQSALPQDEPDEPKPVGQQCRLTVELQKRRTNGPGLETNQVSEDGVLVAPIGESVWIKATLRNVSRSPAKLYFESGGSGVQLQVRTEDGRLAPLTAFGKRMQAARAPENRNTVVGRAIINSQSFTLNPGEEFPWYVQVDRECDLSLGGIFRIRAKYTYSSGIAVSAPLLINVKEPTTPVWRLIPATGIPPG